MNTGDEFIVKEVLIEAPALARISWYRLLFFIVWPFGALINSIKQYREPWSKTVFWLFCVYFGFVFVYYERIEEGIDTRDAIMYASELKIMHENKVSLREFSSKLYKNNNSVDFYQPTVTWVVSLVSDNPRLLFTVFAAIFGFFYANNLWIVYSKIRNAVGLLLLMLMLYYALINPIWNINGVRMNTAAQVFTFGLLQYYINGHKRGLIWCAVSILVHFSFLFPVAILLMWFLIPEKPFLIFSFFLISAVFNEIDIEVLNRGFNYLPDLFMSRVKGYTSDSYLSMVTTASSQTSLHVTVAGAITRWLSYIWIFVLFFSRERWSHRLPRYFSLFLFVLFLGGFTNLARGVYTLTRFFMVTDMILFAILIIVFSQAELPRYYRRLLIFSSPFTMFLIMFKLRIGFGFISFMTFFGNVPLGLILDSQTPIIDYIKQLF